MLAIQNTVRHQISNKGLISCKKRNQLVSAVNDTVTTPTDRNVDADDNHQHHHNLHELLIYM